MAKLSPFNEFFSEPRDFGEGCYVLSAELYPSREEAAVAFADWFQPHADDRPPVDPKRLRQDTVRFQLVSRDDYEWWDDYQKDGRCALWCLGEGGRGAKPVWVLQR